MKFKVGDKVRVRKDLIAGKCYGEDYLSFVDDMEKYKGKQFEIIKTSGCDYKLDNSNYYFNDDMLEPAFTTQDLKVGDRITLRNGSSGIWDGYMIGALTYDEINEDLTNSGNLGSSLDIVKVEKPKKYETIYEREKARKMTVKEISEALGYEVEVVDSHEYSSTCR